jgi:hypothetical protein
VILWAVRWYLMFPTSYRDLELMLLDCGVSVDHSTISPAGSRPMRLNWRSGFVQGKLEGDRLTEAGIVAQIKTPKPEVA